MSAFIVPLAAALLPELPSLISSVMTGFKHISQSGGDTTKIQQGIDALAPVVTKVVSAFNSVPSSQVPKITVGSASALAPASVVGGVPVSIPSTGTYVVSITKAA